MPRQPTGRGPTQPGGRQPGSLPAEAQLTGTALTSLTEAEVIAGGKQIILTLISDTWVAAGGVFDAVRQDIINGISAATNEVTGWNTVVRDAEVVTAVTRISDTVVHIDLTAAPTFSISVSEAIVATIPASATVISSAEIIAVPGLVTTQVKGTNPVVGRKPLIRKISARSLVFAVSGAEQPYETYRFSGRSFVERPKHNPFD